MIEKYSAALGRALAACSVDPAISWEKFLSRAAWELYHAAPKGYVECAILLVPQDGPFIIGRSHATNKLAAENIFGLLVESGGRELALRVKDHARDSFRFFDERIRSSILLRLDVASKLPWCRDGVVWLGLPTVASPHLVSEAEKIGGALSGWLEAYGPVLQALREMRTAIRNLESDGRHFRSLAHDARGPLSALRYVVGEAMAHASSDDMRAVSEQMSYLEQLMESFNPAATLPRQLSHDQRGSVRDVCLRVCQRYDAVVAQAPVTIRFQEDPSIGAVHDGVWSELTSLHLERVLSNMVGNAIRHTPSGVITITLRVTKEQVCISVRDSGAGMSPDRVAELNGEELSGVTSAHGWGLGITFCRERILEVGGTLRFASKEGEGTTVEISLPRVHREADRTTAGSLHPATPSASSSMRRAESNPIKESTQSSASTEGYPSVHEMDSRSEELSLSLGESAPHTGGGGSGIEVVLIDDDADQLISVSRALLVKRISTKTFQSVAAALAYLRTASTVSSGQVAVLCDMHMPDGGSEHLLQELKSSPLAVNVAVASGDLDEDTLYRLAALGAQAFFAKPMELKDVLGWLDTLA